jgi:hypothetical protein
VRGYAIRGAFGKRIWNRKSEHGRFV